MRMYEVPPDISEKEKVIGGILDFAQLSWGIIGLLLGGAVFFVLSKIVGMLALLPATLVAAVALPFMFFKKKGMSLFKYLRKSYSFKHKQKYLINKSK